MASWKFLHKTYDATLEDSILDLVSQHHSPVASLPDVLLDVLCGVIPVLLLAFALLAKDIRIWTKCCLCGSLLAMLKAFLAGATVLPDSAGWEGCKERLGPDGLRYFRAEDRLSFKNDILFGLVDVLRLDVFGIWLEGSERRHPFCTDMMFSGHAYFFAIFSLGIYDLARKHTASFGLLGRAFSRFFVGTMLLALMCCDVEWTMVNRLHYTMDIAIAIVLSLLLFSNPAVAAATEFWAVDLNGEHTFLASSCPGLGGGRNDKDLGELLVPPCCFPLCCFPGRYHLSCLPDRPDAFEKELGQLHDSYGAQLRDLQRQLTDLREEYHQCEEERQKAEVQLMMSMKQAQQAERAKDEQHAKVIDSIERSLVVEKSKSEELELSLAQHCRRLKDEEERHQKEQRSLLGQLEEETVARKRFEERSKSLAQVLITRENERQEAAALLLGAREARTGGDSIEHAAALVASLGIDSPLAKPALGTEIDGQGSEPHDKAASTASAAPAEEACAVEAAVRNLTESTPSVAPELSAVTSDHMMLESIAASEEGVATPAQALAPGIQNDAAAGQSTAVAAGQTVIESAAEATTVGGD